MTFTSDVVIGLEIHVQLNTDTKLFCGCATKGAEEPNTRTCEVCLGFPGSKPVLNRKVLAHALKLCLALNCGINNQLIFSRKSYFYPDMAKNYQITQYEIPLGQEGSVKLENGKEVGITRAHIEEDPAAMVHSGSKAYALIDYNRSGNPLCEIVTEPDMTSPEEARDFMKKLITVLNYLGVFDIQTGIIKADANVSIKESGYVRSEIKNVTGFKEIERALFYEVQRQQEAVKNGEQLIQDTRGWDADKGISVRMRTKETEADYGYILDPDLVFTDVTEEMIAQAKEEMPELAHEKIQKFTEKLEIKAEDAKILSAEKELAELFEKVAEKIDPVLAAKWLRRELVRVMNYNEVNYSQLKIDETHLIALLELISEKKITDNVGKQILEKLIVEPFDVNEYVAKEGLLSESDEGQLKTWCEEAIKNNEGVAQNYRDGKEEALNFLMGQVMRASRGKADPQSVKIMLKELLSA